MAVRMARTRSRAPRRRAPPAGPNECSRLRPARVYSHRAALDGPIDILEQREISPRRGPSARGGEANNEPYL